MKNSDHSDEDETPKTEVTHSVTSAKPFVVLGLHIGHDGTASLVVDGNIVAAVAEERLSRTKQHYGFPFKATRLVLDQAGIHPSDVDVVALGGADALEFNPWHTTHLYNEGELGKIDFSNRVPLSVGRESCIGAVGVALRRIFGLKDSRSSIALTALARGLEACGLDVSKMRAFDHHLAHAVSAYSTSSFDQALGVTIDGYGDGVNTALWRCSPSGVERVAFGPKEDDLASYSPGDFYSYVTCYLGFKRNRHEGKITGLAAYADPVDCLAQIEDLLVVDEESGCFSSSVSAFRNTLERRPHVILRRLARWGFTGKLWDPMLVDELDRRLEQATPAQVASAAQALLEKRVVSLVAHWIQKTGLSKVCLAGGVFANVKLNQRIAEIRGVEDVFVHPNMGDGGLSLGAALLASAERPGASGAIPQRPIPNAFFGPQFDRGEIVKALERSGTDFVEIESLANKVAEAIAEGWVVARFDGRMEYGPRALGNRSILAAPTDAKVNDWLNERLGRTEFMPFAPVVLEEHAGDIFEDMLVSDALRFMTVTLDVKREWLERIPAVCHVDGTARPQILDRENTPFLHEVVSRYRQMTGIPAVINTSFNMHEEPIVCTPDDAIRAFKLGHLDAMAIGPFWIEKEH